MIKCKAIFVSDNDFSKPIGEMKIKQLGLLKGSNEIVHRCRGKDKKEEDPLEFVLDLSYAYNRFACYQDFRLGDYNELHT